MSADCEQRLALQEAALLALLDRVGRLEDALRFEVGLREHMEEIILGLAKRSDQIEGVIKAARRAPAGGPLP